MEKIKLFEVGDEQIHLSPLKPIYANQSLRGGYYYSAADVDATLDDVRALVDESKLSLNWLASYPGENANKAYERLRKAIAAVERRLQK